MKIFILISFMLITAASIKAQDQFTGTWQMDFFPEGSSAPVKMELQVGLPEKNLLYPARLTLQYDSFSANYHLLMAKKNTRQLAIGRNKYPVTEMPFSLGNWTIMLNGTFDFSKDGKGTPILTANRISAKKYGIPMPDPVNYADAHAVAAIHLRNFLKDVNIQLKKINNNAWNDQAAALMLQPELSPAYFGISDTFHVKSKDGIVRFQNNKDNDIISVTLNGRNVVEQVDSRKKREAEEVLLDTGLNILLFFADDYGNTAPSGAALILDFESKKPLLDFAAKKDIAANFIAAKIYYDYDESNNTRFETNVLYNIDQQANKTPVNNNPVKQAENPLQRDAKLLGSIIATKQQIKLAIWDDALEDGDSISLSINGKWIAQGFPVKKKPQFLTVTLDPGPNVITFVADNLGSVVPNTSVLEIIDGKRRKSFMIDTDLNQNNLVKIFYDYRPEK